MTKIDARPLARPLVLALALAALALAGCGEVRSALGIGKSAPDEFAVVRHAGLAVPPNADLRPPAPGAPRPQALSPRDEAREALVGRQGTAAAASPRTATELTGQTPGEKALMRETGAEDAPVNIRDVVRIEAAAVGVQDRTFTDTLLFWKESEGKGEVIDPVAEAERLRRQQEGAGAPPAPSDSGVVIERKKGGLLGDLF